MRCVENCASFRTFATDWIPVKETRRNYYGNTSVNQEQSTWKCLQLRYSTNTGLWLHTLRALLRLTVAISLPLKPTVQLFSYIPVYILPNFSVIRSIFLLLTKYFKFHFFYLAVSLKQAVRSYASNNLAI